MGCSEKIGPGHKNFTGQKLKKLTPFNIIIPAYLFRHTTMIYLDNNATTIMPPNVQKSVINWMNKGNPSADYKTAKECRELMKKFREYIADRCGFISYEPENIYERAELKEVYQIIFTSCASESNNTIIRSVIEAYSYHKRIKPHLIISAIEHKSLIGCAEQLVILGKIELTIVRPNKFGVIPPENIESAIKTNTCLISIMHANNETGAINDIKKIGAIAHKYKVPFHTDTVQTFGKFPINPLEYNVDAFSISFHKLHGPPGIGALIIKRQFVQGYHILPEICGTQNCGLRGGTENISGIAGAFTATQYTWANRPAKNKRMLELKRRAIKKLSEAFPSQTYREYLDAPLKVAVQIVFISTAESFYLPNTLLFSVVRREKPFVCNGEIKRELERNKIIISIGSACNTSSDKASHVLNAIGADYYIRRGTLRASIGDDTTQQDIDIFVETLARIIGEKYRGKKINKLAMK